MNRRPHDDSVPFNGGTTGGYSYFWVAALVLYATPSLASFDLSYVLTGRIWVPALNVPTSDVIRTNAVVALMNFGSCGAHEQHQLRPRPRDCHFERQLADAIAASGMFQRVVDRDDPAVEDIDFIIVPWSSRVEFQRQMIPIVKPLIYLTLFTYVWTPFPYESDLESYAITLHLLDRNRHWLEDVTVERQHVHCLGTFSADRYPPADFVAALGPSEKQGINVCTGPHAASVVHELLQKLGATISGRLPR